MSIRKRSNREHAAHLQGTLDLLILRTLILGPQHGQGIARTIQRESDNVLIVDHGSLYPALQRLEDRGFIEAEWGTSENNRKARFYTLTRQGRRELIHEESEWRRIASAIMRVLGRSLVPDVNR
jgi:transcriptional regulator